MTASSVHAEAGLGAAFASAGGILGGLETVATRVVLIASLVGLVVQVSRWLSSGSLISVRFLCLWIRRPQVRVSFSVLLHVERAGRYVLVLTPKRGAPEFLGPLGGVVKSRQAECRDTFRRLGVTEELHGSIEGDDMTNDLRIFVGRSSLMPLLRWLRAGVGREDEPQALRRELGEELPHQSLESEEMHSLVPRLAFKKLHRSHRAFADRTIKNLWHLRIFNVYHIVLDGTGERFEELLLRAAENHDLNLRLVSQGDIARGVAGDTKIGAHSASLYKKRLNREREDEPSLAIR